MPESSHPLPGPCRRAAARRGNGRCGGPDVAGRRKRPDARAGALRHDDRGEARTADAGRGEVDAGRTLAQRAARPDDRPRDPGERPAPGVDARPARHARAARRGAGRCGSRRGVDGLGAADRDRLQRGCEQHRAARSDHVERKAAVSEGHRWRDIHRRGVDAHPRRDGASRRARNRRCCPMAPCGSRNCRSRD